MAAWNVQFHCGCGYKTQDAEEAKIHSDKQGHTVIAQGTISPETSK